MYLEFPSRLRNWSHKEEEVSIYENEEEENAPNIILTHDKK